MSEREEAVEVERRNLWTRWCGSRPAIAALERFEVAVRAAAAGAAPADGPWLNELADGDADLTLDQRVRLREIASRREGAAPASPAGRQEEAVRNSMALAQMQARDAVVDAYREAVDALDRLDAMDHPQTSVDLFRDTLTKFERAIHTGPQSEAVRDLNAVENALRVMARAKGGNTGAECESLADIVSEIAADLGSAPGEHAGAGEEEAGREAADIRAVLTTIANPGFDYGNTVPWQTALARAALAAEGERPPTEERA